MYKVYVCVCAVFFELSAVAAAIHHPMAENYYCSLFLLHVWATQFPYDVCYDIILNIFRCITLPPPSLPNAMWTETACLWIGEPICFTHTIYVVYVLHATTPAIVISILQFIMRKIICLLRTSPSISCVRPSACLFALYAVRCTFGFYHRHHTTSSCILYLLPWKIYFTDSNREIILQYFYLHYLRRWAVDFSASAKLIQLNST